METKIGESTLPQDHEDQLQLGIRICQTAFQNKIQTLEQEIRGLRLTSDEQRANLAALQKKNSALEVELVESHQRSQQLAEENKELFKTVGSLRKQIGRLEHLKAAVLSSVQDDAEKEAEMGDTRALMSASYLESATPLTAKEMGLGAPQSFGGMPGGAAMASRGLQPAMMQSGGFAGGMGGGGGFAGGMGGGGMGGGGGGTGAAPPVDGKAFFRAARSRLSHEAFNQFLASIKRLNNQQQTREDTLEEARRLFGPELGDLYNDFETLLNRQGGL
mmetsp:Transcript_133607/g.231225  ORF Transcript_133607/g.231225 Transcript_133607/m.231225 type:complete len:275 (+) Transcript_133607:55-879(+)